jgi:hypothetical protein
VAVHNDKNWEELTKYAKEDREKEDEIAELKASALELEATAVNPEPPSEENDDRAVEHTEAQRDFESGMTGLQEALKETGKYRNTS